MPRIRLPVLHVFAGGGPPDIAALSLVSAIDGVIRGAALEIGSAASSGLARVMREPPGRPVLTGSDLGVLLEPPAGIEPATYSLRVNRSTD